MRAGLCAKWPIVALDSGSVAITGHQIRQERRRRGFTQQQLADAAGVSLRTIGRVERGEIDDPRSLDLIALELGLLHDTVATDEERVLRSVADSALLAEVARRFGRGLETPATQRGRGERGTLPPHLTVPQPAQRTTSDGVN